MNVPKVLCVTLACGEAELQESIASVTRQQDVAIDHHIINDQPEREAHNALLELFRDNVEEYDMYVKVDADTIVDHDNAFAVVLQRLTEAKASAAQLYLLDFFTLQNINGLNFYAPKLNSFLPTNDPLFCDRSIVHNTPMLYSSAFKADSIIPVGRHCAFPHDMQAFHYGYHRGLKGRTTTEGELTRVAAVATQDRARILAWIGFKMAQAQSVTRDHNYTDERFLEAYSRALQGFDQEAQKLAP